MQHPTAVAHASSHRRASHTHAGARVRSSRAWPYDGRVTTDPDRRLRTDPWVTRRHRHAHGHAELRMHGLDLLLYVAACASAPPRTGAYQDEARHPMGAGASSTVSVSVSPASAPLVQHVATALAARPPAATLSSQSEVCAYALNATTESSQTCCSRTGLQAAMDLDILFVIRDLFVRADAYGSLQCFAIGADV